MAGELIGDRNLYRLNDGTVLVVEADQIIGFNDSGSQVFTLGDPSGEQIITAAGDQGSSVPAFGYATALGVVNYVTVNGSSLSTQNVTTVPPEDPFNTGNDRVFGSIDVHNGTFLVDIGGVREVVPGGFSVSPLAQVLVPN